LSSSNLKTSSLGGNISRLFYTVKGMGWDNPIVLIQYICFFFIKKNTVKDY